MDTILPVSEHFRTVFSIILESIQNFCINVGIWFFPLAPFLSFITKWRRRKFFRDICVAHLRDVNFALSSLSFIELIIIITIRIGMEWNF